MPLETIIKRLTAIKHHQENISVCLYSPINDTISNIESMRVFYTDDGYKLSELKLIAVIY